MRLDGGGFSSGGDDKVLGNLIGTKKGGKTGLPNLLEGVDISGASNNNVSSNTIAFNGDNGARVKEDTISANHDANSNPSWQTLSSPTGASAST